MSGSQHTLFRRLPGLALALALAVGASVSASTQAEARKWRHDPGAALAAGIIGFAAGAIAGSALAQPRYQRPYHYTPHRRGPVYYAPAPRYYRYGPPPVYRHAPPPHVHYRAAPGTPDWIAYCARKYRSFNPRTGTYLAYSGQVRYCR